MLVMPTTRDADAGGLQVQGQPGLHSETLSQNKIANKQKTKYKTEQQQKPNVLQNVYNGQFYSVGNFVYFHYN